MAVKRLSWAEDISGRSFAIFGAIESWPRYHGGRPEQVIATRGGFVRGDVDESLDHLVLGRGRIKGKAKAERKALELAEKGAQISILDEVAFVRLLRPDLRNAAFHFAGALDLSSSGLEASSPAALLATLGATLADTVDETLDFLVIGERRGAGKAAAIARVEALNAAGAGIRVIDEPAFLELVGSHAGAPSGACAAGGASPLSELVAALPSMTDTGRIKRAIAMLRAESMRLYADVADAHVVGIVRSQSRDAAYSARLAADGSYGCCDDALQACMGMQGGVCKHVLALLLGLVQSGELDAARARGWLAASRSKRPSLDVQPLADTILRYRAAEAGELDWRPTETVPEDFYAF